MKTHIVFFITTSAFAILSKLYWTEKRYNQEIKPLKAEIQKDVNENVNDELFDLIFNSTYSEKEEFRQELSKMNSEEKLYLEENLEFILNGNVYPNLDDKIDNDNFTNYDSYNDRNEVDLNDNDTDEDNNYEYDDEYESKIDQNEDWYDNYYGKWINLGDLNNEAQSEESEKSKSIPTKLTSNEKRYQEMKPLKEEIQHDVNQFIKAGLFAFIFNSTYAEKQEFRDEFLNEINPEETSYLKTNIDFILNDDRNVRLNMQMMVIFILSFLLGVLLKLVFILWYMIDSTKKEKLNTEKPPIMSSLSKPKFEKI